VRVGTFNLLHGRSVADGTVDADALRASIGQIDVDVLAVQEVDRDQPRSHGVDQTAVVADTMGADHSRFVPTVSGIPGGEWSPVVDGQPPTGSAYGIGLVSRLPVSRWYERRFGPAPVGMPLVVPGAKGLTHVDDEPRAAVAAVVETDGGSVTVIATHLSFVPGWNVAQLRAVVRWARSMPAPRVLLGDLNLPARAVSLATRWTPAVRAATYPSWRPRVQFDHVLLDRVAAQPGSARTIRLPVSDHLALVADLDRHW
jgi:endonuclease/exonuclease/phosphatase family metal-dependent hydrolase